MSNSNSKNLCSQCPSFVAASDVQSVFGKSVGAPMCAKFGHVLGRPGFKQVQQRKIEQEFASRCDDFGKPAPSRAISLPLANVSIARPDAARESQPTPAELSAVGSCLDCKFYVAPDVVQQTWGWPVGACAARGKLLLSNKLTAEARNCESRKPVARYSGQSTLDGMMLFPMFDENLNAPPSPLAAFLANKGQSVIDPSDYETDAEVTPEEAAAGIRAWREVNDPSGSGKSVMLPIFRRDFFDPIEQSKIPETGDDNHPEWYIDAGGYVYAVAVAWMELDETPALWGPAGVGKTQLAAYLAWLMQVPYERISITKSSNVDDLAGKPHVVESNGASVTGFTYGRVPKAWQKPCVLIIDEPNVGDDEVWQFLRPLTDNAKQLVLDQNEGERLPRHDNCYLMMAMNPAWDAKNIGANEVADADTSRTSHIFMGLPPEPVERHILLQVCEGDGWTPSDTTMDFVMNVAKDIRALAKEDTIPISWGIRHNMKAIRYLKWFAPEQAYRRAAVDFLEPEVGSMILRIVSDRYDADKMGELA